MCERLVICAQHHVRSSSGGSAHEVLHGGVDHPVASSSSVDACEKTGLLQSQVRPLLSSILPANFIDLGCTGDEMPDVHSCRLGSTPCMCPV